jgi:hypothetical protein
VKFCEPLQAMLLAVVRREDELGLWRTLLVEPGTGGQPADLPLLRISLQPVDRSGARPVGVGTDFLFRV